MYIHALYVCIYIYTKIQKTYVYIYIYIHIIYERKREREAQAVRRIFEVLVCTVASAYARSQIHMLRLGRFKPYMLPLSELADKIALLYRLTWAEGGDPAAQADAIKHMAAYKPSNLKG